ncbi:DEAD/DEAH box helicase [Aldersonia sp. NBC_00410]|uniref:DEAD/DEAH box helicase n=1 Tax=Aldersonia sp. NBC_00410 TaxID=2975954 RepID=UPI00225B745E|nr:DEAD/DEAH box helicase [Aldersonia sp. NBC_00410]MCX5043612.1 DEAD/DEAH box helicase [Aldersonia sp. NBC_00410]
MLHGLWSPGAGLLLWRDEIEGPPLSEAFAALTRARFRHRVEVLVPGGAGVETVELPARALAPHAAAEVLLQRGSRAGQSGDLRYLAHVARGIERWVAAGRVVPEVHRAEGQWWTRWRLLGGERQRAWLAELAVAMPAVQRAQGPASAVLADLVAELTDPVVRLRLAETGAQEWSDHPLTQSLFTHEPLEVGSHAVGRTLEQWRTSLTVDEPELVLRLLEPDEVDDDADPAAVFWRLEVCLRPEGEAPQPIAMRSADAELLRIAGRKLGEAMAVYPRLRDVPSDSASLDLLLPTAVVTDLVTHGAMALREAGVNVLLPRAWNRLAPSLRLRVQTPAVTTEGGTSVGMNELVGYDWELALGDSVLTHDEMERLARAKADLVRLRGQWVQADHVVLARAARYVAGHDEKTETTLGELIGELTAAHAPPLPVDEVTATGWVRSLLDPQEPPAEVPVPAELDAELRPYQLRGLNWLAAMSRLGLGAVLADDMGLGKTVQLLALLAHEKNTANGNPTLLVCPMSVVGNWQREAQRFVPSLRVLVHHGPGRRQGGSLAHAVAQHDLVVTTYAIAARDVEQLRELTWDRVVLDEAQHVKNSATAQSRAVRSIPARHRLALTGTPVENRLEELRSILDFANPKMLGSAQSFRARFAVPIERDHDETATARLRTATAPFVLRRVKTDPHVISDLPEKFEMTVRANLTAEQASLYKAVVEEMLRQIEESEGIGRKGAVLAALTRLKQVCNHPAHYLSDGSPVLRRGSHRSGKLGLVEDVLESVLADGEKALLFTQFREFGELIAPYLTERFGTRVPFLHGGVSKARRDAMVTGFAEPEGPPIMLLSLKAGGTGLNLTAANHVVHLDRWWNPAVENQATDRAFRIGQRRDVQVRKLVCVGTIEERIDAMLSGKQELADLVVGAGENWVTELSTDALRDLMRLGDDAVGE